MFMVSDGGIWGILMTSAFMFCGISFVVIGLCYPGEELEDVNKE